MSPGSSHPGSGDQRGLTQVVGVALLVAIVVLLAGVTIAMTVTVGNDRLDAAAVHDTGEYAFDVEDAESLRIQAAHRTGRGADATFQMTINGQPVHEWDGTGTVAVECLYPGDRVVIRTVDDDGHSRLVLEHVFDHATTCPQYNTFPEKFAHAIVEGTAHKSATGTPSAWPSTPTATGSPPTTTAATTCSWARYRWPTAGTTSSCTTGR